MPTKQIAFLFLGLALFAAGILLRLHIQNEERSVWEQDYAYVRQKEQRELAAERFARLEEERKRQNRDDASDGGNGTGKGQESVGSADDEGFLGIFSVQTNPLTDEREIFLFPGRVLASFPKTERLFAAPESDGRENGFFSQSQSRDDPRCRLWLMTFPSMKLTSYGWQGVCHLTREETPNLFVLDYVPFGTREHVFLPVAFPPDSDGVFSIAWERHQMPPVTAPEGGSYAEQSEKLLAKAETACGTPEKSQDCEAVFRALAFLELTRAPNAGAADGDSAHEEVLPLKERLERLSPQTADFIREIRGDLKSELAEITSP